MGERAAMAAVWWMMGGTLAAHHRAGSKRMSQIVEPHFLTVFCRSFTSLSQASSISSGFVKLTGFTPKYR